MFSHSLILALHSHLVLVNTEGRFSLYTKRNSICRTHTHTVASVRVSRRLKTTRHILISSSSSSALQLPCSLYYYLVTILHTSNSLSPEGYHSRMLMTADGACACVCQRGTLRFLSFAVVCRFCCTRPVSSISASQTPCAAAVSIVISASLSAVFNNASAKCSLIFSIQE